jgi:hypothetical protein
MNPALLGELIRWMALVPGAINVVSETVAAVRALLERDTPPTDEELEALVNKIKSNHENLPLPE